MRTRFKTFGEFVRDTYIGHGENGSVKIICRKKPMVVMDLAVTPWNSKQTKRFFLSLLYFQTVLVDKAISDKIQRIVQFKLLGTRCNYNGVCHVIVDAWQGTNKETGEICTCLKIYLCTSFSIISQTHPFDVVETQITFL